MSADAMTAHRMISERDRVIVDQAGQIRDLKRELDRWRHGATIEGDFVCPNELELRRWRELLPIDQLITALEGARAAKERGEIFEYRIVLFSGGGVAIETIS